MTITISLIIIIISSIVSIIAFNNRELFLRLLFNPYDIKHFKNYYRFITYGFVHADWTHLIVNMFVLFSFGRMLEYYYTLSFLGVGKFYYILLYFGAIAISALPSFNKYKDDYSYNAVGASGAVSAVLFATVIFNPLGKMYVFPFPIGIPSVIFAVLYLAYSWYMNKRNVDNIGHDAHFWGAIFGLVFTLALKPSLFLLFIERLTQF